MEDPEYAKAFLRRILILEGFARYHEASELASWCIKRFDNEYEEQESQDLVSKFHEVKQKLEGQLHLEEERRADMFRKEVE